MFIDNTLHLLFHFFSEQHDGFLLGDKGYPLLTCLMTPYRHPQPAQERFNAAHGRSRTRVEQAFGILKRRFHCLHDEIRLEPEVACKVIVCAVILNNIALRRNDEVEPLLERRWLIEPVENDTVTGAIVRDDIQRNFFA